MDSVAATVHPKAVAAGRGTDWLGEGFELFRKAPGTWIGIVLIWFAISALLSQIPVGPLINSFLNPVFQAGVMLGCASLVAGSALRINHLFSAFSGSRLGQLLLLGVFTLLAGIVLVLVSVALMVAFLGGAAVFKAPEQIGALGILLAVLIVLALTLPLVMAIWFAPALIVLDGVSAWQALMLSFRGCLLNIGPFLLYGVVALVMLIVACIPLFLGLLVAVPVLVASIYTGYRDIFSR
jgi:uncharacterized membrane protein